jgi:hypothetical protein
MDSNKDSEGKNTPQRRAKTGNNGVYRATPQAMARKERFSISPLGEFYMDVLTVDSWINARSRSIQANSLLCAKLQEREPRVRERVAYLAKKRGISADELWAQILQGVAAPMEPDDDEGSDRP